MSTAHWILAVVLFGYVLVISYQVVEILQLRKELKKLGLLK